MAREQEAEAEQERRYLKSDIINLLESMARVKSIGIKGTAYNNTIEKLYALLKELA